MSASGKVMSMPVRATVVLEYDDPDFNGRYELNLEGTGSAEITAEYHDEWMPLFGGQAMMSVPSPPEMKLSLDIKLIRDATGSFGKITRK